MPTKKTTSFQLAPITDDFIASNVALPSRLRGIERRIHDLKRVRFVGQAFAGERPSEGLQVGPPCHWPGRGQRSTN
eukprot:809163-Rhodomonas_salina.3